MMVHASKPRRVEMKIAVRAEVRDALGKIARERWGRERRRTDLVEEILEQWLESEREREAREQSAAEGKRIGDAWRASPEGRRWAAEEARQTKGSGG